MAKVKQIINIETNLRFIVVSDCRICTPPFIAYLLMDTDEVYIHTVGPDEPLPKIGEEVDDERAKLGNILNMYTVEKEIAYYTFNVFKSYEEAIEDVIENLQMTIKRLPALYVYKEVLQFLETAQSNKK